MDKCVNCGSALVVDNGSMRCEKEGCGYRILSITLKAINERDLVSAEAMQSMVSEICNKAR